MSQRLLCFLRQWVELAVAPCCWSSRPPRTPPPPEACGRRPWSSRTPRSPPPLELADSGRCLHYRRRGRGINRRRRSQSLAPAARRPRSAALARPFPSPPRRRRWRGGRTTREHSFSNTNLCYYSLINVLLCFLVTHVH